MTKQLLFLAIPVSVVILFLLLNQQTSKYINKHSNYSSKNARNEKSTPVPSNNYKSKVNFNKLEKLLSSQQWQKADIETANKLLEIAEKQNDKKLEQKDLISLPVEELKIIDALWQTHSQEKFGFSIQREIWLNSAGKINSFDSSVYDVWAIKVGWREQNSWKKYSELDFTSSAPKGHLPAVTVFFASWGSGWCGIETILLFSRIE